MLTSQQFSVLQTELTGSAYQPFIASGNLDGIVSLLNDNIISIGHFINRSELYNALANGGVLSLILNNQTSSDAQIAGDCQSILEVLRHSGIEQYRLENGIIQSVLNTFETAGLITAAEAAQASSVFVEQFTNRANQILGRDITLQDLWDFRSQGGDI